MACAERDLHLALVQLPQFWFGRANDSRDVSDGCGTCLRSVLMKPEHRGWLDEIWTKLTACCDEELGSRKRCPRDV